MKKRMSALLCGLMCLCLWTSALGAETLSLPEKMLQQIEYASGIKGALRLETEGEGPWSQAVAPLTGIDLELRALVGREEYEARLYIPDGEEERAVTRLWGNAQDAYLRSEALEQPLQLPVEGDVLQAMLSGDEEKNANWYAIAYHLLQVEERDWQEKWLLALAPYEAELELWLSRFGDAPVLVPDAESGKSIMTLTYTLPVDSVKAELKQQLPVLLADQHLTALLEGVMTPVQKTLYWNPYLMDYYTDAIDGLYLDGDIVLEREMSALGVEQSLALQFPIPENEGMWESFRLEQESGETRLALVGADQRIDLSIREKTKGKNAQYTGQVRWAQQVEGLEHGLAADYALKLAWSTHDDEEGYLYETTELMLSLTPEEGLDANLLADEASLEGIFEFRSKNANRSATRLNYQIKLALPQEQLTAAGNLRTANPWEIEPMETEGAQRWTALSEAERADLWSSFTARLTVLWAAYRPAELPLPVATATDLN